jgi:hypothetical protein
VSGAGNYAVLTVCRQMWPACPEPPIPAVAAPHTGNSHVDLFCYLVPAQALIPQLQDLLRGGWMRGRTDRTDADAGPLEMLADRAPMNAQFGTDLAQGPALGV